MGANLVQAAATALKNTALIFDDIPATAANLIQVESKNSHPDTHEDDLPKMHKGKHMSEGEFYRKAAVGSLAPKVLIGMGLGIAAGGLSLIGATGVLTVGLVPLALWICGKSAEKEEHGGAEEKAKEGEYKPAWTDKLMKLTPGMGKFLNRLPTGHRRILSETIKMDIMLEMEMMVLAAVALGASGVATAGLVGFAATVALVPTVALAATAVVWSTAFGVRKLRSYIGKKEKAIEAGGHTKTPFDKVLGFIDRNIEPALGIIGKLALMSIGGALLVEHAFIPLAQMAIPHLAASVVPYVHSAIHLFDMLPGLAQTAVAAPLGFAIGKFVYNPLIVPAMSAIGDVVGKIFKHDKKKESKKSAAATPVAEPAPASKVGLLGRLCSVFKKNSTPVAPAAQTAQPAVQTAPKPAI